MPSGSRSPTGSISTRFTLVYLRNAEADFEVELTVNKGRTEPYALGDGYGHVAFVVDDLDAEHAPADRGAASPRASSSSSSTTAGGWRAFFFVADPDGYQIEVIGRGGRFR